MTYFVVDRDNDDRIVAGPFVLEDTAQRLRDSMAQHPSARTLEVAEGVEVPLFDSTPFLRVVA
jgi:hypothetical protein